MQTRSFIIGVILSVMSVPAVLQTILPKAAPVRTFSDTVHIAPVIIAGTPIDTGDALPRVRKLLSTRQRILKQNEQIQQNSMQIAERSARKSNTDRIYSQQPAKIFIDTVGCSEEPKTPRKWWQVFRIKK